MARDAITVTNSLRAGVLPTLDVPNDGNNATVANANGRVIVVFVSGLGAAAVGAAARTVQILQENCPHSRGADDSETAFAVTNDTVAVFGPFPPLLYNTTDDLVEIDYVGLSTNQSVFGLHVS
jgi:hypothetical protein